MFFILFCSVVFFKTKAQDSLIVLPPEDYLDLVKAFHPMAQTADLQRARAAAELLRARGSFDPQLLTDLGQKYFDDKSYYSLLNAGLQVPTWFGVKLKAGYMDNSGQFLNPENNLPQAGLWYTGIEIPLLQNLVTDERRTMLRQAQVGQDLAEFERLIMLNDLLFEAVDAYWKWFSAYHAVEVFQRATDAARFRLNFVRQNARSGESPIIDTVEASIQLQNRQIALQEARLEFANAGLKLSTFLWSEDNIPLEITPNVVPIELEEQTDWMQNVPIFNPFDSLWLESHPMLQSYVLKIDQIELERKLNRNQLLPKLNVEYNLLSQPNGWNPYDEVNIADYQWKLGFQFPLALRKERGKLEMTEIKQREIELEFDNKRLLIENKIREFQNTQSTTSEQAVVYRQTVRDYNRLLAGEQRLFSAGESSLFLVNIRELGFIDAQLKLIELISKNRMAASSILYAAGQLPFN
jgi:outer membrane protein TolC